MLMISVHTTWCSPLRAIMMAKGAYGQGGVHLIYIQWCQVKWDTIETEECFVYPEWPLLGPGTQHYSMHASFNTVELGSFDRSTDLRAMGLRQQHRSNNYSNISKEETKKRSEGSNDPHTPTIKTVFGPGHIAHTEIHPPPSHTSASLLPPTPHNMWAKFYGVALEPEGISIWISTICPGTKTSFIDTNHLPSLSLTLWSWEYLRHWNIKCAFNCTTLSREPILLGVASLPFFGSGWIIESLHLSHVLRDSLPDPDVGCQHWERGSLPLNHSIVVVGQWWSFLNRSATFNAFDGK